MLASHVRVVLRTCLLQLRTRASDPTAYMQVVLQPLVFGTSAIALFATSRQPGHLVYALLGGGLVGLWSATLFNAAFDLQIERWAGTVELLMATPAPFVLVVAGKTLTSMVMGAVPTVGFVALGLALFHQAFAGAQPALFVPSVLLTLLAFFALGMTIAAAFTIARAPGALANGFEMPALILCGFLFPPSQLPVWAQVLSWALPPTWAVRALYRAAGQAAGGPGIAADWALAVLLSAVYLTGAVLAYRWVESRSREGGQLALL